MIGPGKVSGILFWFLPLSATEADPWPRIGIDRRFQESFSRIEILMMESSPGGALTYATLSGLMRGGSVFPRAREAQPWALLLDPYRVPHLSKVAGLQIF